MRARVDVIRYGTKGKPGDIWKPDMFKIADCGSVPIQVALKPKGWQNLTIAPAIPETLGAYLLIADLGTHGRQLVAGCVRTFQAEGGRVQCPQLGMDVQDPCVLRRLGCKSIRRECGYKPTTDRDFPQWLERFDADMRRYWDANVSVIVEFGAGGPQPLGRPRPHLSDDNVLLGTKSDMVWLPEYDADFQKLVKLLAVRYGWPRGPVTAMKLWNEPWEGLSISGWGADMPRYREIYTALCEGVEEARREAGIQILLGGCDSSSNTFDKFFGDGSDTFLKWLDFVSIHYQGMQPPSTVKQWVDRKPRRVLVWDTESWVANSDDRVAAVVATNMSTGHDRAVGIYGGNICTEWHSTGRQIRGGDGKPKRIDVVNAWSVAAAVGAVQRFIGERKFREMVFKNGLPWVMAFDGLPRDGQPNPALRQAQGAVSLPNGDDGTVVVVGDIGDEFGHDFLLFRTARGFKELAHKLDHRGFFLRTTGAKGSFAKLLEAVRSARIEGIEPLATECLDMLAPIEAKPTLRLRLTNVLNRPVAGKLAVTLGKLQLEVPATVSFQPHEGPRV